MKASEDVGKLILRVAVGGLLIFHGIDKIIHSEHALGFLAKGLAAKGLPDVMKYGIYVGEVAAPALLILGFFTRLSALAVAGTMGMAIWIGHGHELLALGDHGGWAPELAAFFLLGALSIALLGPGSMALDGRKPSGT